MSANDRSRFVNRELSWLEFNARVLSQALSADVPLLDRLKFLCIVFSNLDEFFMVRVASVKRQIREGDHVHCPSGVSPSQLQAEIFDRTQTLVDTAHRFFLGELVPALAREGILLRRPGDYSEEHNDLLRNLFRDEIFPVLTPVRVSPDADFPYTSTLRLHAAFLLEPDRDAQVLAVEPESGSAALAIVQIPSSLYRLIPLPEKPGTISFALLEDVIVEYASDLFPGCAVLEHCLFRVTRDADLSVDEERDEDFVEAMQDVLADREYSRPVRLTITEGAGSLKDRLCEALGIPEAEVFEQPAPLDIGGFMDLTSRPGYDHLRYTPWTPQPSPRIPDDTPIWDVLKRGDVLLHHPFEQFDPVTTLLKTAATDPGVLSIKITLYRTSGNSPIVRALEDAAKNGKQVTALVELKARFDEERNISWATRLERAGAIVVYGIARLKVHAKALLIVRRESGGVVRYSHLGTGNYNDKTARLYTDFGLLSSQSELAYELGQFFNAITGYSAIPRLRTLAMAPVSLKSRVLRLIERETLRARSGETGRILAKLNSLADPDVIEALYEASSAGVSISINVRGICMLRPGVPGLSENIRAVSIVDRYLEHARAFYFENGGSPEVYCSSADWMPRNLERRVELMFPIEDPEARQRIIAVLDASFRDNQRSHLIGPDGRSTPLSPARGEKAYESQFHLQRAAEARSSESDAEDRRTFSVRRRSPEA